MSYSEDV